MSASEKIQRLRWRCRRGMWELDILLESFLLEAYPFLLKEEQEAFEALLKEEDQDLYTWFQGVKTPENLIFQKMVQLIREHTKKTHTN